MKKFLLSLFTPTSLRNTAIVLGLALVYGIAIGCGDAEKPQKNRVPTVTQQLEQARQAAQDAKASADQAQKALDKVNDATKKLSGEQRDSDGNLKEGRPEKTAPGVITSVFSSKIEKTGNNDAASEDWYLGFNFTDVNGYTKKFFPMCPDQTISTSDTNGRIALLYHWQTWQSSSNGQRGCYRIDGYQQ